MTGARPVRQKIVGTIVAANCSESAQRIVRSICDLVAVILSRVRYKIVADIVVTNCSGIGQKIVATLLDTIFSGVRHKLVRTIVATNLCRWAQKTRRLISDLVTTILCGDRQGISATILVTIFSSIPHKLVTTILRTNFSGTRLAASVAISETSGTILCTVRQKIVAGVPATNLCWAPQRAGVC